MDLISRQAAKEYCAECDHNEVCRWYPYEGCEFRSLPSAQPEQRWIPVTERLPEKKGLYLITCVDDRGTPFVDASLYDPPTDWRGAIWDFPNVVAWMERPEPYKGKEEC